MRKYKWAIQLSIGWVLLLVSLELWPLVILGIKGFVGFWCFFIGAILVFKSGISFDKMITTIKKKPMPKLGNWSEKEY